MAQDRHSLVHAAHCRQVRASRYAIAAVAILLLSPQSAASRPSQQVPVGPRALGMGGAFSSIADDATALFWNPAGLPFVGHQEVTGTHADLYNSGIVDNLAAFVLPLSPRRAAAIDWYHSGFQDPELNFDENRVDFSYAQKISSLISLGATAKWLSRKTDLDGTTVRSGNGFGFDVGLLATPFYRVRAALVCQDITNSSINYSGDAGTTVAFPRNFRAGVSYGIRRDLILALDADDRWHTGVEYRPLDLLALRAGLQDDWSGPDGMTWSAGVGIQWSVLRFDYALVHHPTLGSTSQFGLTFAFNFNPAQIRIEKVEPHDIYSSLYKTYAREPFGTIRIRNLDDQPVVTQIWVLVPQLMHDPSELNVILRPKVTQEIPMTAVLSEQLMRERGDRPVQVEVSATYQSHQLTRTERSTGRCVTYGPGAIDWGAGVPQAAAFVTTRDPAVDALARDASRTAALMEGTSTSSRNLTFTAAIFDALSVLGMAYVPDPNNPYATISGTARAVDTVSYPSETLARRTGDCDDTSVLLAALLGNVGIATQLVDVPGHLFLLVDTGIHERNRLALGLDESRYVVVDEKVWIPLETTALGKGFAEGWRVGAESYAGWSARGRLALVDVTKASNRYEPADLSGAPAGVPTLDSSALEARVTEDLATIGLWRQEYLASRYGEVEKTLEATPQALNEVARVYFLAGKLEDARATLEKAKAKSPDSPQTSNNLANVYAAQGNMGSAIELYEAAVKSDASDAGLWLNLGLVRYVSGDSLGAEEPFSQGVTRSGGYLEACKLLGLSPEVEPTREGAQRMTAEEARLLLKAALQRVPRPSSGVPEKAPTSTTAVRHESKWTSRTAAGRSAGEAQLQDLLYWRER